MRKVSVPIMRFSDNRDAVLKRLNELDAYRVFLCVDRGLCGENDCGVKTEDVKDAVSFFKKNGYEVGVWLSSLGHGGSLPEGNIKSYTDKFTRITGITGESAADSFCPLDESFTEAFCSRVASLAGTGASLIMFDDDFRLANRPGGFGCFCDRHMAEYSRLLGENISREELFKKAFCGSGNRYRDAVLKVNGDTLYSFAEKLRKAVDEVDSSIRMGFCACLSSWDFDGVDCFRLAEIFAGKNEPFLRLIGAPYWAKRANFGGLAGKPACVIELERMQSYWCKGRFTDIMSEGDVFPRPRYNTPAAYLEGFDTAFIANGAPGGILKYAVDYYSTPEYETGYCERAAKNKTLYSQIESIFRGKRDAGVFPACAMHKVRDIVYPGEPQNAAAYCENSFIQPEQAFLCNNSIPVKYEKGGVCSCFGQNAAYINPDEFDAFILDVPAALIFASRGVDAGIASSESLSAVCAESYPEAGERVSLTCSDGLCRVVPDKNAKIISYFEADENPPGSYCYKNSTGKLFYVLCADMDKARTNLTYSANYCRQKQLIDIFSEFFSKKLPAVCPGNPDLYIMCKIGEKSMAVGMWNYFEDYIQSPCIELDRAYKSARFINCDGRIDGNKVFINGDLHAYSFLFFEVTGDV